MKNKLKLVVCAVMDGWNMSVGKKTKHFDREFRKQSCKIEEVELHEQAKYTANILYLAANAFGETVHDLLLWAKQVIQNMDRKDIIILFTIYTFLFHPVLSLVLLSLIVLTDMISAFKGGERAAVSIVREAV